MKKNKLIGAIAISAMMGLSGCNVVLVDSCVHEWSTWEIIDEPTCIDKGARMRYCDICGKTQTRSMPIDQMYGHRYVENPDADSEATCTTNGVTGSQICLRCGQKKRGTTTELKGHEWQRNTQATDDKYVAADCTHPGLYQNKCKNCPATDDVVEDPLGHSEGSVVKDSGVLGVIKCKRCNDILAYELDVTDATGFNTPNTKMSAKSGSTSMATWTISSYVGNTLPEGYYDIQLEAAMTDSSHANRKMYNMSKTSLCVDGQVEETATGNNADKTTESDYRYFLQINATDSYNPTTKKSYGDLGLGTGAASVKYFDFVSGVQIDSATQTISLRHGNIGYSLFCRSIRLIPHTHILTSRRIEADSSKGTIGYTIDKCDCGYRRIIIDAIDGKISDGKQNALNNNSGYLKLPDNNDSVTYKIDLDENVIGNVYVMGRQDVNKMDQTPYNCDWNVSTNIDNNAITIANPTKPSNELLSNNNSDMAGYSDEGKVLIGNTTLKENSFGENVLTYKRLDDNNLIISKIVFEGRPAGHIHYYARYAQGDVPATCRSNRKECSKCSCGLEEYKEIPDTKASHNYIDTPFEADCYTFGEIRHKCKDCNISWTEFLPKEHTLGEASTSTYGYKNRACTACEYGGEATWTLTQSMIEESADGSSWAASTATPITGKMSDNSTDMSVFKFDNSSYKRVTLTFNNEGDEIDAVLRIFATTQVGDNMNQTQPYRQTIGESASTMRFNLKVNGSKVSFGSTYYNLTMKDIGLEEQASKVSDNGYLADAMWLNYFKISLAQGENTIVFETANLVGHNVYIGGFQLAY